MLVALNGCKENLYAPELPAVVSDSIPAGQEIDTELLAGRWLSEDSNNLYELELTAPEAGIAILNHFFISSNSEMPDSVVDMAYSYTYDAGVLLLSPTTTSLQSGTRPITAVHVGDKRLALYVQHDNYTNLITTVTRRSGARPVLTGVNRTLPQVGDKVTVYGRNLTDITSIYLPVEDGELEITDFIGTSTSLTFMLPAADYRQGAIRCLESASGMTASTPAYMFAYDGVMMHSFNEYGTTKADHYAGTDFEYSINDMGSLRENAPYITSADLPETHSLYGSTFSNPDTLLSFFGESPISWPIASGTDSKKGYLRFSTGDRLQAVLSRYEAAGSNLLRATTLCSKLAIQMDIYVVTDGAPVWKTGYISYRINKDQHESKRVVANMAGWNSETPMDFTDGWQTFTIPLSTFDMTAGLTLQQLITTILNGNLQTILTVINYNLDELHPATAVEGFQFSIANIRLVPYE